MQESMMKSKNKLVRVLIKFQPIVKRVWFFLPTFISRILLSLFRNGSSSFSFIIRYLCISKLAKDCGEKVIVFPGVYFKNLQNISFGTNISIHEMCYMEGYGGIIIGNDVAIGHGCSLISSDHDIDNLATSVKNAEILGSKIVIGNDVWLGAGVKILKGVTVSNHAVIGAGAVVTSNILEWSVAVGVPAKHIKYRKCL